MCAQIDIDESAPLLGTPASVGRRTVSENNVGSGVFLLVPNVRSAGLAHPHDALLIDRTEPDQPRRRAALLSGHPQRGDAEDDVQPARRRSARMLDNDAYRMVGRAKAWKMGNGFLQRAEPLLFRRTRRRSLLQFVLERGKTGPRDERTPRSVSTSSPFQP